MGTLTDAEKHGLRHFFLAQEDPFFVIHVAQSLTKNVTDITTVEEALEVVFVHSLNIRAVLNKRIITKELLFRYLHLNKIQAGENLTKVSLVDKILEFWETLSVNTPTDSAENTLQDISPNPNNRVSEITTESSYPIHQLARKFTEWFFRKYNEGALKLEDFWSDARLDLRIIASDATNEETSQGSEAVLDSLQRTKELFKFYFNPNITHESVQGRIDIHGLVLVLSCGTLHTTDACVGVFETVFSLARDPFSENNWKIKTLQVSLRSTALIGSNRLVESETLKPYLTLPAPPDIGN